MPSLVETALESIAPQKPQGRLHDLADLVVPDGVLTHEHDCVHFVEGGIKLAQLAAAASVAGRAAPIQRVRCRGEVFFFVGQADVVFDKVNQLPDIPPPPDQHPDEGWDESDGWD